MRSGRRLGAGRVRQEQFTQGYGSGAGGLLYLEGRAKRGWAPSAPSSARRGGSTAISIRATGPIADHRSNRATSARRAGNSSASNQGFA